MRYQKTKISKIQKLEITAIMHFNPDSCKNLTKAKINALKEVCSLTLIFVKTGTKNL